MNDYNMAQGAIAAPGMPVEYRPPSLTEQMKARKVLLEQQLEQVNIVLAGLEKNPDAAELFDAISRLGGLRG